MREVRAVRAPTPPVYGAGWGLLSKMVGFVIKNVIAYHERILQVSHAYSYILQKRDGYVQNTLWIQLDTTRILDNKPHHFGTPPYKGALRPSGAVLGVEKSRKCGEAGSNPLWGGISRIFETQFLKS